jgi:hypothetical protein
LLDFDEGELERSRNRSFLLCLCCDWALGSRLLDRYGREQPLVKPVLINRDFEGLFGRPEVPNASCFKCGARDTPANTRIRSTKFGVTAEGIDSDSNPLLFASLRLGNSRKLSDVAEQDKSSDPKQNPVHGSS